MTSSKKEAGAKRTISLERTYRAPIEDVWALWTTKEGIESWWGPHGFSVKVRSIVLRPGGRLVYVMSASTPEMIETMKAMGAPVATEHQATYTEVAPHRRLVYEHAVDFIPDTQPYAVTHVIELHETPRGVRLVLTFDVMHAPLYTDRARMGWTQELEKLALVAER